MLKIEVKQGENIDRALKRYKQKVRRTKQMQQLRTNEFFTKKSIKRREEVAKAKYKQELKNQEEN